MSYYGPSFANIESGWYRTSDTATYAIGRKLIDSVWVPKCDEILEKYVITYGTFFTAFDESIIKEIDQALGTNLKEQALYYGYYLANRAYEMPNTRKLWLQSHQAQKDHRYKCNICLTKEPVYWAHPNTIALYGLPPRYCRICTFIPRKFKSLWNDKVESQVAKLFSKEQSLSCDICRLPFTLSKEHLHHPTFDHIYPNLFAQICPTCIQAASSDYDQGSPEQRLSSLYELFEFTEKIPTQDFASLLYLYRDRESITKLLTIFQTLRTPEGYKKEFGSFFSALVRANVIPEGSRKMTIGTMLEALDGHLCLSLVEKDIDDFLNKNNIAHNKEVHYPDSYMRTDWELHLQSERIFVEYFGLMNIPAYAEKAKQKLALADKNNITLIPLYPEDDWKKKILERLNKK